MIGEWLKLAAYRERLKLLLCDNAPRRFDGAIEVTAPGIGETKWSLNVHAPEKWNTYTGASLSACVDAANADLDKWVAELAGENEAAS